MRLLAASGLQAAPVLRSGSMPFLASNLRKSITRQASLFGGVPDFIVLGDAHAHLIIRATLSSGKFSASSVR
jgi:hypothetical protein